MWCLWEREGKKRSGESGEHEWMLIHKGLPEGTGGEGWSRGWHRLGYPCQQKVLKKLSESNSDWISSRRSKIPLTWSLTLSLSLDIPYNLQGIFLFSHGMESSEYVRFVGFNLVTSWFYFTKVK